MNIVQFLLLIVSVIIIVFFGLYLLLLGDMYSGKRCGVPADLVCEQNKVCVKNGDVYGHCVYEFMVPLLPWYEKIGLFD